LKRRWFRTLPNYYLILLINIGIAAYIGYSPGILWHYFFFSKTVTSQCHLFFRNLGSLAVEEYAYFILPLCLVLVRGIPLIKQKSRSFLIVVLALIGLFIVAKIGYTLNSPVNTLAAWNVSLKAVVVYRLDSIFIGFYVVGYTVIILKIGSDINYFLLC